MGLKIKILVKSPNSGQNSLGQNFEIETLINKKIFKTLVKELFARLFIPKKIEERNYRQAI